MTKTPIAVLGIDLGKNSCSLAGVDAAGAVVLRKRMSAIISARVTDTIFQVPASLLQRRNRR